MRDLRAQALAWLTEDPDPDTRAELRAMLDSGDTAALAAAFAGDLEFGTAGLRGALGPGPARMNRVVVTRAAAGLAAYLREQGMTRGVVIGYDARHKSDVFARDTAEVVRGAGMPAYVLPRPLPTPVLAYAIRHLDVSAGVMVTASHNPPQDNGYKVYLGDGSQIVPPADAGIAACIRSVGQLGDLPRSADAAILDDSVLESYLDRVASLPLPGGPRDLVVVTTPLHGVGGPVLREALRRAGFPDPHVVAAQAEADPDFPTVAFPNPEEPGAMDLALRLAADVGADLVLANDPDADRCAVAVADRNGVYRMLRGDEVGALLAAHLLARGLPPGRDVLACSIVSSSLLSRIAAANGLTHVETLTGFKWIGRVPRLAYGYEEALGYCVDPEAVRDKDGVSAALLVAELAAGLKAKGRGLLDLLDDLAVQHGLHATDQLSVRIQDVAVIPATMSALRSAPPASLGGREVQRVDDLTAGFGGLPPTDGLRFHLAGAGRVVVRPSGTEPKVKSYLEVVLPVASRDDLPAVRARARRDLDAIRADLADALSR
ncbi:MAG TPA: phospho-sugar mutase [Actinomycetes bacterium]|nr:phospho-sugar mutase [Actinomycetes bacterium]